MFAFEKCKSVHTVVFGAIPENYSKIIKFNLHETKDLNIQCEDEPSKRSLA